MGAGPAELEPEPDGTPEDDVEALDKPDGAEAGGDARPDEPPTGIEADDGDDGAASAAGEEAPDAAGALEPEEVEAEELFGGMTTVAP